MKMETKEKFKQSKAITLIALVITIIILVILATITILELRNTSLLSNSTLAKTKTIGADVGEKVKLAIMALQTDSMPNREEVTLQKIHDKLPEYDSKITLNDYADGDDTVKGKYKYNNNNDVEFEIDKSFNVIIGKTIAQEKTEITITYDANGGTNAPKTEKLKNTNSYKISETKPSKDGTNFLGWAENSDAKTSKYYPGENINVNDDKTLYAVYGDYPVNVNGSNYGSLKEALDTIDADEITIILYQDVYDTQLVALKGKKINLILNTHSISNSTGTTLVAGGGTFNVSTKESITRLGLSGVTINGNVSSTEDNAVIASNGGVLNLGEEVSITGNNDSPAVAAITNGTVNIAGGTYTGGDNPILLAKNTGTINIKGGTYTKGTGNEAPAPIYCEEGGYIKIDDGNFENSDNNQLLYTMGKIEINGGTLKQNNPSSKTGIVVDATGEILMTGGTYTGTQGANMNIMNFGKFTLTGGLIDCTCPFYNAGTTNLQGGTINSWAGFALYNNGGKTTISGNTTITGSETSIGINIDAGELEIQSGTFHGKSTETAFFLVDGGECNIKGGTFDNVGPVLIVRNGKLTVGSGAVVNSTQGLLQMIGGEAYWNGGKNTTPCTGNTAVYVQAGKFYMVSGSIQSAVGDLYCAGGNAYIQGGTLTETSGTHYATVANGGTIQQTGGTINASYPKSGW